MENIRLYVQELDNTKPVMFHNANNTEISNAYINENKDESPMIIVSVGGVRQLAEQRVKYITCVEQMPLNADVGTIIANCSADVGIKTERVSEIHQYDPTDSEEWTMNPCAQPLSISKIAASTQSALCKGGVCRSNVDYSYLFRSAFFAPHSNVMRASTGEQTTSLTVGSLKACRDECDLIKSCLSWSYDGVAACYINSGIPGIKEHIGGTAGVCKGRYVCGISNLIKVKLMCHASLKRR
jgi:hypothetical protein